MTDKTLDFATLLLQDTIPIVHEYIAKSISVNNQLIQSENMKALKNKHPIFVDDFKHFYTLTSSAMVMTTLNRSAQPAIKDFLDQLKSAQQVIVYFGEKYEKNKPSESTDEIKSLKGVSKLIDKIIAQLSVKKGSDESSMLESLTENIKTTLIAGGVETINEHVNIGDKLYVLGGAENYITRTLTQVNLLESGATPEQIEYALQSLNLPVNDIHSSKDLMPIISDLLEDQMSELLETETSLSEYYHRQSKKYLDEDRTININTVDDETVDNIENIMQQIDQLDADILEYNKLQQIEDLKGMSASEVEHLVSEIQTFEPQNVGIRMRAKAEIADQIEKVQKNIELLNEMHFDIDLSGDDMEKLKQLAKIMVENHETLEKMEKLSAQIASQIQDLIGMINDFISPNRLDTCMIPIIDIVRYLTSIDVLLSLYPKLETTKQKLNIILKDEYI